jgi:hypothetical protein
MGWFMLDNATNNDMTMRFIENPSVFAAENDDIVKYDLIEDEEYPGLKCRVR